MKLDNKVVLITGPKGGLGNNVTKAFLAAGARVAGTSRSISNADFEHANFAAFPAEINDSGAAGALAASVIAKWGRIDALVHLVGGFAGGPSIADTGDATLDKMLAMNFKSAFHIVKAVLPAMRAQGSGRILAIGSRAAVEPAAGLSAYSASKAALISLIRTAAIENKDRGICANVILPGTMDTPVNRAAMPDADPKKWVQPDQVAALLVHLASDDASDINGAVIPMYGGDA